MSQEQQARGAGREACVHLALYRSGHHVQHCNLLRLSCHKLRDYARAGLDGIVACLPLHRQRPGQGEAFELDLHKSLADNLLGKTVVEFPVLHVGLKGQDPGFALVRGDARGGEGQPEGPEST